jgi:acetyl esterase/lipase
MGRFLSTALCVALFLTAATDKIRAASRITKDIEFASVDGHSLKLDLYLPSETKDPTLVVWIHGGGWQAGDKSKCEVPWLAGHGYAVASISYRLTDQAIFPAQVHDCKAAVRWLRAHAGKYGYRCDQMAVAGSSAGGMLAALMGTSGDVSELEGTVGGNLDHSSRLDAVIDYYGATDFILRSRTQPHRANKPGSVVYKLLGGGADKKTVLAKLASAVSHVSADDPPMLVIHGDQDKTVLIDQSEAILKAYRKAQLPIEFKVLAGAAHGGQVFYTGERRNMVLKFLDRSLANRGTN